MKLNHGIHKLYISAANDDKTEIAESIEFVMKTDI